MKADAVERCKETGLQLPAITITTRFLACAEPAKLLWWESVRASPVNVVYLR